MARGPDAASRAQQSRGLPPGLKFFSPFPFSGMNTLGSPIAIDDKEFPWVENFLRLGDAKLRTAYDAGAPLYTAPMGRTIVFFYFFTIATDFFVAVFLDDGSAVQVTWPTGATKAIGPAGTFYKSSSGFIPACTQWGVLYLLISNRNSVNDYWAWDGTLLYTAGTVAPNSVTLTSGGENYGSLPTVTAFGGHGSGIVLTPTINAGAVVNVAITNPGTGYEVGDIVQAQFKGGGSDNGPIITASLNAGGVAAANITDPGTGYTHPVVAFSGGGGSGAAATAIPGNGVATVTLTAPGSGYTGANVTISGGSGSGATATATVNGGEVTGLTLGNPGTGYVTAPTVTISGDGTGATGTATIQTGGIVAINITSPGTGYTSAPAITITDSMGGTGTGATAVAVLGGSAISGCTVVDGGTGFLYCPILEFEGGFGTGAAANAFLQNTSVARVDVLTSGQDYQRSPKFISAGQNTSVTAKVNMNGQGGVGNIAVENGGSYTANPGILLIPQKDDTGSGATARSIMSPVPLGSVVMANYGLNYIDAPTVIVQPGANRAAYALIGLMPFGLSGVALETYQSRVWIANPAPSPFNTIPPQGDFSVTAPGSITDVATSDGGLIFTNTDPFLQTQYVAIRQSNGYIYFLGDGSVSVGSNVQTAASGNPPVTTTTLNYQTVDPDIGCDWRDSVGDYGKTILFANATGVYGVYGGAATKVGQKMDDVFLHAVFPPDSRAVIPTAAVAHLFEVKHYLLLMTITDPDLGTLRNAMLAWNEKEWVMLSQGPALTRIGSQKRGSTFYAWGTDGSKLYPLFNEPSSTLVKRLDTKVYGSPQSYMLKELDGVYLQANDKSGSGITLNCTFEVSGKALQDPLSEQAPSGIGQMPAPITWDSPDPFWNGIGKPAGDVYFAAVGARFTTTSEDFVWGNLLISYRDIAADR